MSKTFTREEVAKHNTEKDAYVIINNKVYDITSYVNEHPGGDWTILMKVGDDSTHEFNNRHRFSQFASRKHSSKAVEILEKFYIGDLIE